MDAHHLTDDDLVERAVAGPTWASACLSALMDRHGISARHQAAEIAQICAISVSQARRKLRGAVWLFDEVVALCQHFGESLDTVFAAQAGAHQPAAPAPQRAASTYPATLLIDPQQLPCDIQLGPLCTGSPDGGAGGLVACHHAGQGWLVSSGQNLLRLGHPGPYYGVTQLQLRSRITQARARIAVLDDDVGSATALTDWFNEVGYEAQAFHRQEDLLAQPLTRHDAYVVDLILEGGTTSQGLVERIRQVQPEAPIVLLTGQLKDGTASEATLATILRTQGVTFFEKPVRPAVLTAAIQSSLDRLGPHHA
jgi:CheY-like chemotaxis protein